MCCNGENVCVVLPLWLAGLESILPPYPFNSQLFPPNLSLQWQFPFELQMPFPEQFLLHVPHSSSIHSLLLKSNGKFLKTGHGVYLQVLTVRSCKSTSGGDANFLLSTRSAHRHPVNVVKLVATVCRVAVRPVHIFTLCGRVGKFDIDRSQLGDNTPFVSANTGHFATHLATWIASIMIRVSIKERLATISSFGAV